jgi:hypothetical protein
MDPVTTAINNIKFEVPREILNQAFMPKRYDPTRRVRYQDNVFAASIDELIRTIVVDGRVAIDVNLLSGTEMVLPLSHAERDHVDPWNVIYRFGTDVTGGRRITAVYEVLYGVTQGLNGNNVSGLTMQRSSAMLKVGRDILNASVGVNTASTSYCQLVGQNTVLVNDVNQMIAYGGLRCRLSHELNFNDIKPVYYHAFGELVTLATKAYIYNTLVIDLDEGAIKGGASLGRIREIVDQYADANQMYKEYLTTKWQRIGMMNDTEAYRKVMKLALGARPKF